MNEEEYTISLTVPVDELIHTEEHLFCDDLSCPCHEDQGAIQVVMGHVTDGLMTFKEADLYYSGRTL
jgi:hypothetical protein